MRRPAGPRRGMEVLAALERIDPVSRATLELTARRHLSDATMGTLLGLDAGAVAARRDAAADALAAELGTSRERAWARACELPEDEWPEGAAAPRPGGAAGGRFDEATRWRLLATAVLVVVTVAGLAALVARGADGTAASATAPAPAASGSAPASGAPAPERPTSGPSGTAVVSRDGGRVRLIVSGLDPGTYGLWLYTGVIGARPLAALRGPGGTLTVELPADARDFVNLDLSRQPGGRIGRHSGESVLRVATDELRPGASVRLARPGI